MPISQKTGTEIGRQRMRQIIAGTDPEYLERQKKKEEHEDYIKSIAKELSELVVSEKFVVNSVLSKSEQHYMGPSNPVFGKSYTPTKIGVSPSLVLNVTPENKDLPIRRLTFEGFSIVSGGSYIIAEIPRYKFEECLDRSYYIDREFKEEEKAMLLATLSKYGDILREDRATDYESFHRE